MCHAPGDPNHHEVCATITPEFWTESGQGHADIQGNWCICIHKLDDWLRSASEHLGISKIDCSATSVEALKGDPQAAKYLLEQCPQAASQSNVGEGGAVLCLLAPWMAAGSSKILEGRHRCPPN